MQLQECIQPETHRPLEPGWIKLQLEVAETCAQLDMLQLIVQAGSETKRNSGTKCVDPHDFNNVQAAARACLGRVLNFGSSTMLAVFYFRQNRIVSICMLENVY